MPLSLANPRRRRAHALPALLLLLAACVSDPTGPAPADVPPPTGAGGDRAPDAAGPCTLQFSGFTWCVRQQELAGPGPNRWDARQVWVDVDGLHLRLSQLDGVWSAAELFTESAQGFGTYEFVLGSRVDALDPNVVLGLFTYPTADQDGLHEIDIELARWGDPAAPALNWTVYPAARGVAPTRSAAPWDSPSAESLHRFVWKSTSVAFASYAVAAPSAKTAPVASWTVRAPLQSRRISQGRWPLHLNLWLFGGRPPVNGMPVEIVIRAVRYRP